MRTMRKHCLTSEAAANFIEILMILPSCCDFIVDDFNNKLRTSLDAIAPFYPFNQNNKNKENTTVVRLLYKKLKKKCRIAERR